MTVPAYTDISHFRAPYKNAYFAGFGQEAPPPPPGPPGGLVPDPGMIDQMVEKKGGIYYWRPEARAAVIETLLPGLRTIFVGGMQELVEVVPFSSEEIAAANANPEAKAYLEGLSAYNWMKAKLKENKVVLAPIWISQTVSERSLVAIPAGDTANITQSAATPLYAILAEPSLLDRFPGGLVGVAIAGAAVLGGVALVTMGGMKRRGRKAPSFRMS
jgi:hypothetical protein